MIGSESLFKILMIIQQIGILLLLDMSALGATQILLISPEFKDVVHNRDIPTSKVKNLVIVLLH